jgi:hypothetical protein
MDPVDCDSCGARFPVSGLTEDDCQALDDQHYYEGFAEELRILRKVQEYYRRHPDSEGRIKANLARLLESDDPELMQRLWAGVPFDEIELPPPYLPAAWAGGEEDREVVEYLRHNDFLLGPRRSSSPGKLPASRGQWGRSHAHSAKSGDSAPAQRTGTSSPRAMPSSGFGRIGIALIATALCT